MAASDLSIDWGNLTAPSSFKKNLGTLDAPVIPSVPSLNWGAEPTAMPAGVNPSIAGGANPLAANGGSPSPWQTKWFGGTNANGTGTNGIIPGVVGAGLGLASAWTGFQQLNLAKDQLKQNKDIFNLNFMNQAKSINTSLEDRQRARVASNAGAYQSVGDYMKKNSVNDKGI